MELFSRNYYFPGIRKEVEKYINKCQNCQLNKYSIYILYGYIQYVRIADYFWQNITIDFIMKFPKSEDLTTDTKYDNILIVVDKLIKYAHLILYNKGFMAK